MKNGSVILFKSREKVLKYFRFHFHYYRFIKILLFILTKEKKLISRDDDDYKYHKTNHWKINVCIVSLIASQSKTS